MVSTLTASQSLYLRSLLHNTIKAYEEDLTLQFYPSHEEFASLSVYRESENAAFVVIEQGEEFTIPSQENLVERLVQSFEQEGDSIILSNPQSGKRITWGRKKFVQESFIPETEEVKEPAWAIGKSTHLEPKQAAPLLKAIGLMSHEGEIKAPVRKKFKQINHFLELLSPMLSRKPKGDTFYIVDCGCGKSYLGFVLFWYLRTVLRKKARFLGIDVSSKLIQDCQDKASELGMKNMEFECSPMMKADLPEQVDLLISLHACDTATDEAIACAVAHGVEQMAVAPCCQQEIAAQLPGIPKYPLKKHGLCTQRFGEMLTDMMRALFLEAHGYTTKVGEFISWEETPKNLLLRGEKGNPNAAERMEQYEEFKRFYQIRPSIDGFYLEREAYAT